jgi:3-hydroxyisobutyrate dehydrogenase
VRRLHGELSRVRFLDAPVSGGPRGAGTVAKLAHNCASFAVQAALAEAFTLGVKAGVEPLALFKALRQGALGRKRTFDRLPEHFLPGKYDPAAFTVRLAHKDATLAINRGWAERDCRVAMTLQEERADVSVRVPAEQLRGVRDD